MKSHFRASKVNSMTTEPLSNDNSLELAKFAEKNNLSVATVINRILTQTINDGALVMALTPPFEGPVNSHSKH